MKKWFVLALMVCVAAAVQADQGAGKNGNASKKGKNHGQKDMTKEQFFAQQKRMAEKKGRVYSQATAEKRFNKLDTNKDGILTAEERANGKNKNKNKNKGKNKGAGAGGSSAKATE